MSVYLKYTYRISYCDAEIVGAQSNIDFAIDITNYQVSLAAFFIPGVILVSK